MMLTAKGRYAVTAMVDIAVYGGDKPVTIAKIAERQEITVPYLEQIFVQLRRAGLVKSIRGPGGGYILAHTADGITVSDVVLAVDETIKMTRCGSHGNSDGCLTDKTLCLTHNLWKGLGNHIHAYMQAITLKDICDKKISGQALSIPGGDIITSYVSEAN